MFKKKFDHTDINNFLPCNKTIGTVDFFNKKFKNNMPEHICELLSVETLIENEEEKERAKEEILNKKKEYTEKLLKEYEDRKNDIKDNIDEIYDKYLTPNFNIETEIKNLNISNE